jgi:hypothetical protein
MAHPAEDVKNWNCVALPNRKRGLQRETLFGAFRSKGPPLLKLHD